MAKTVVPVSVGSISILLTQPLRDIEFKDPKVRFPHIMNTKLSLDIPEIPPGKATNMTSPWSLKEIRTLFAEANKLWLKKADIEFKIESITRKYISIQMNDLYFDKYVIESMSDAKAKVKFGFLGHIDNETGGWAVPTPEGGFACLSYSAYSQGSEIYGGLLLAHELGHILTNDIDHQLANGDVHNIMYKAHVPNVAKKGLLTSEQIRIATDRAKALL